MPTDRETLHYIKRLCILNFLELQDMRRRMNIPTRDVQDLYDYANAGAGYVKALDDKMRNLIKEFPHLLNDEKPANDG